MIRRGASIVLGLLLCACTTDAYESVDQGEYVVSGSDTVSVIHTHDSIAGNAADSSERAKNDEATEAADAPLGADWTSPEGISEHRAVWGDGGPIRGLYLNAWAAGSRNRLANLITMAERSRINTFVIDVKEGGEVSYRSNVPMVEEVGSGSSVIRNPESVVHDLLEAGIRPVARIVLFRDPILARARPDLAVQEEDGELWKDQSGYLWVDPFNQDVWDYNLAIAREAAGLGFVEIQFDYVRFPDAPNSYLERAVFPARDNRIRIQGIRDFLDYAMADLEDLDIPITIDVFGLATSARTDLGIGQTWEEFADMVDGVLPMTYPSHYTAGSYGLESPNHEPYQVIYRAMNDAIKRNKEMGADSRIIPWLQSFTLGSPRYETDEILAQIRAVEDAGLKDWILWNPGSRYSEEALLAEASGDHRRAQLKYMPLRGDTLTNP